MARLYPSLRQLCAAMCAWEIVGIETHRVPTFSELSSRHRWLAPAILVALAIHLSLIPNPSKDTPCSAPS